MKGCKHDWGWIGETQQSDNEWCYQCGAWKRLDKETGTYKINHPRLAEIQKKKLAKGECSVCRGSKGKHSSLCGELYK